MLLGNNPEFADPHNANRPVEKLAALLLVLTPSTLAQKMPNGFLLLVRLTAGIVTAVNHLNATNVLPVLPREFHGRQGIGYLILSFAIVGLLSTLSTTEAGDARETQRFVVSIRGSIAMQDTSISPDGLVRDIQIRPAGDVAVTITSNDASGSKRLETVPSVFILREGSQTVIRLQSSSTTAISQPASVRGFVRYAIQPGETPVLTVSAL